MMPISPRRLTLALAPVLALSPLLLTGLSRPALAQDDAEPAPQGTLTLHADQGELTIAPEIYGHFTEHLGRCVYGGIWVGPDSDIPNTRGIRNDVVKALKAVDPPVIRWPGGCYACQYHWRDGIGPSEDRPRTPNIYWGGVDTNAFGTHEFMDFIQQVGSTPYIGANVATGTPSEMMDWLQYMTYDGDSTLAQERRDNGQDEPWKVPFLGIGNENWGCGGNMRPEYYADLFRRFSTFAHEFSGNDITRIASGPGGDDMHWLDVVAGRAGNMMDGISLHYYTLGGASWSDKLPALGFKEDAWFSVMDGALGLDDVLNDAEKVLDKHDADGRIGLYVDEWGTWYRTEKGDTALYQQNSIRDALVAGVSLNIFNHHAKRVKMANIAQTVNVLQALILTDGPKMLRTPTYHVFRMYKVHQGATLLPIDVDAGEYEFDGKSVPRVSASASRDDQGRVHVSLCNVDPNQPVKITTEIADGQFSHVTGEVLTAPKIDSHNTFDHPDRVTPQPFKDASLDDGELSVTLPAKSVVVLELTR